MTDSNGSGSDTRSFSAAIERHHPGLPVYVIVPERIAEAFGKKRTFVVECLVNGQAIGRRSIKPWGDGRWFLELTKRHCRQLAVAEGDLVSIDVSLPAREVPPALLARIREYDLEEQWRRKTEAERRAIVEGIWHARKESTRAARIEMAITVLLLQEQSRNR